MHKMNRFGITNRELYIDLRKMVAYAKKLEEEINNDERNAKLDQISQQLISLKKYERQINFLETNLKREKNLGDDKYSKVVRILNKLKKASLDDSELNLSQIKHADLAKSEMSISVQNIARQFDNQRARTPPPLPKGKTHKSLSTLIQAETGKKLTNMQRKR